MEDQINFESRIDFTDLNEKITRIRERMGKVIIGQREVADLLLTAMLADGHILIEGVPGIAKTLMAKVRYCAIINRKRKHLRTFFI